MNRTSKMVIIVLSIFIIGMTMGAAVSEPVCAKKIKDYRGYYEKIRIKRTGISASFPC